MEIIFLVSPVIILVVLVCEIVAFKRRQRIAREQQLAKAHAAARERAMREEARKAAAAKKNAAKSCGAPRKPGRPRKEAQEAAPQERSQTVSVKGNNMFAGQVVAFTGTLPGMTRQQAIQAVLDNGGKAFDTMPADTTLLVVGEKPGGRKLDKADKWITQVRKITPEKFFAMLQAPLTFTPDDFAAYIAAMQ